MTKQIMAQPTIKVLEIMIGEDFTPPEGYALNEIKTSTSKGKGLFYAVCVKIPEGGLPEAPKKSSVFVPGA